MFTIGQTYTRSEVQSLLNVPPAQRRGAWQNGYNRYNGELFIFCNVGIPGRTGHDYPNRWDGDDLIWLARTGTHVAQPLMKEVASGALPIHVFWRDSNKTPRFNYQGIARPALVKSTIPVEFRLEFGSSVERRSSSALQETDPNKLLATELGRLIDNIQQRIANSGLEKQGHHPSRRGPDATTLLAELQASWTAQAGTCRLCGGEIPLGTTNPLLKISADRLDSLEKHYGADNTYLTHLGCNLAKNNATYEQWLEYLEALRAISPPSPPGRNRPNLSPNALSRQR